MPTKTKRTEAGRKPASAGITVSERGNYQVTFGRGALHNWLVQQARKKGCDSIPELVKRLAQEAFEQAQATSSP